MLCTGSCGGLNARGNVAVKIDCTDCDQTGYANFWTRVKMKGYYSPGVVQRWNATAGALSFLGDSSIKFDFKWKDVLDRATSLEFNGAQWQFSLLQDPGETMGQHRLIYVLNRL